MQGQIQRKNTNNKLTTQQTGKIPENKKPIDRHPHPEQKFHQSQTIAIFRNRQIFSETELPTFDF